MHSHNYTMFRLSRHRKTLQYDLVTMPCTLEKDSLNWKPKGFTDSTTYNLTRTENGTIVGQHTTGIGQLIFHPTQDATNPKFLWGVYSFTNKFGVLTCGQMLLVRADLDAEPYLEHVQLQTAPALQSVEERLAAL